MQLLEIFGFVIPSLFFIILYFFAEKRGAYLSIFFNMMLIPLGIIINTLKHNIDSQEYAIYALFIVYMMGNLQAPNFWIKILAFLTTTCAVCVAVFDFYNRFEQILKI